MKRTLIIAGLMILCLLSFINVTNALDFRALYAPMSKHEVRFVSLGWAAVIINTTKGTIIVDPASFLGDKDIEQLKAGGLNLILYTHSHGYLSYGAVKLFKGTNAPVLAESTVAELLSYKIPTEKVTIGKPGETYNFGDFKINVIKGKHGVPANLYQIEIEDLTLLLGGGTDYVPLKDYPSDIAFLPTGSHNPRTCSPEDAFKMLLDLKSPVTVPVHGYGPDKAKFKEIVEKNLPDTKVIIPVRGLVTTINISK